MRLADLHRSLDRLEYPVTTDTLASRFGSAELELSAGTERLERLLGRLAPEEFESPESARLSLYGALPESAVGRKGYSDRDPPAMGEFEPVSF